MKITQTDNQMEIKTSGLLTLAMGIILIVFGAVVLITVLTGIWKVQGNGQSTSLIGPIAGALLAVGGIVTALLAKNQDTVLQKGGTSTVSQKRVLFGGPKAVSFDTSRIRAVCLFTEYHVTNDMNSGSGMNHSSSVQRSSQLSLMLDDNSLVQIASKSGGGGSSINGINITRLVSKAPLSDKGNQIAQFLGVPLKSSGDVPSPALAISTIVDAVHENTEQKQVMSEQPPTANQPPVPTSQPNTPVEPTQPPENTNWQS
jgi:hypothetical protein